MPEEAQQNEVTVRVDGGEFHYWDDFEATLGLDYHPSVGFTAPFEATNLDFRRLFNPLSFTPCDVAVGGDRLFTGKLIAKPSLEAASRTVDVSAYSLAAELERSDVPAGLLPMQSTGLNLSQIAAKLVEPFAGVQVVMDGPEGAAFRRVKTRQRKVDGKVEGDQKIQDFLVELARQRGLVMTSTVDGHLRFWQSAKAGRPVVTLRQGEQPLLGVEPTFSPFEYYSEITGFTNGKHGAIGAKYTERNQRISGGFVRALGFRLDDIEKGDIPAAVKAKMGRMFGNVVHYVVHVPTWRDPQRKIWNPNTTIKLYAPDAMIYTEYEFLVRDVILRKNKKDGESASLGVVLPGAFSGEAPAKMPWEE
jgi:prophage tail gpP-like protein